MELYLSFTESFHMMTRVQIQNNQHSKTNKGMRTHQQHLLSLIRVERNSICVLSVQIMIKSSVFLSFSSTNIQTFLNQDTFTGEAKLSEFILLRTSGVRKIHFIKIIFLTSLICVLVFEPVFSHFASPVKVSRYNIHFFSFLSFALLLHL